MSKTYDLLVSMESIIASASSISGKSVPNYINIHRSSKKFFVSKIENPRQPIWLHAYSLGEVDLAVQIAMLLRRISPSRHIILSSSTSDGMKIAKSKTVFDDVFWHPFDNSENIKHIFKATQFEDYIDIDGYIVPRLYGFLREKNINTTIVNARCPSIRSTFGSIKRRAARGYLPKQLNVFSQDEKAVEYITGYEPIEPNIEVHGNLKLAFPVRVDEAWRGHLADFTKDGRVLCCCSIYADELPELMIAMRKFLDLSPTNRVILIPRNPGGLQPNAIESELNLKALIINGQKNMTGNDARIAIVNGYGAVGAAYDLSEFCYVGGTFNNVGGHNLWEPVSLGKPVFCGPNVDGQRSIHSTLHRDGVCIQAETAQHLADKVTYLFDNSESMMEYQRNSADLAKRYRENLLIKLSKFLKKSLNRNA